jgi:hypothetical protein
MRAYRPFCQGRVPERDAVIVALIWAGSPAIMDAIEAQT